MSLASKILNEVKADETLEEIKKDPSKFFNSLKRKTSKDLKKLGCSAWDDPDKNGKVLMLFPHTWYNHIPDGYEVIDIDDEKKVFGKDRLSKDHRFGSLAFGVKVKK